MHRLQALVRSWLRSAMARNASSAALHGLSTRLRGLLRNQTGVLGHRLGDSQISAIPHGYAIWGFYGPLCTPVAQNDEDWVSTPSSLVCSVGGV